MKVKKGAKGGKVVPVVRRVVSKKKGPKRMSGYQFFLRACLDEMKARFPDASIVLSVVSKLCAQNWQNMSEETRQRFYDQAEIVNSSNLQADKVQVVKKERRVYKKRPLSGYKIFCSERRLQLKKLQPHFSKDQVACQLANMWMNLDPVFKSNYEKLAKGQLENYQLTDLTGDESPAELSTSTGAEEVKDDNEKNEEVETTEDEEMQMQG